MRHPSVILNTSQHVSGTSRLVRSLTSLCTMRIGGAHFKILSSYCSTLFRQMSVLEEAVSDSRKQSGTSQFIFTISKRKKLVCHGWTSWSTYQDEDVPPRNIVWKQMKCVSSGDYLKKTTFVWTYCDFTNTLYVTDCVAFIFSCTFAVLNSWRINRLHLGDLLFKYSLFLLRTYWFRGLARYHCINRSIPKDFLNVPAARPLR